MLRLFPVAAHFLFVPTFHSRRLPHYHAVGQPVFLTWRLNGSLPANRAFPAPTTSGQAFLAMDRLLDTACTGPLYLLRPEFAKMVVEAIHYEERDMRHCQLHSYVVMPNHVHLLITPLVDVSKGRNRSRDSRAGKATGFWVSPGRRSGKTRVTIGWFVTRASFTGLPIILR